MESLERGFEFTPELGERLRGLRLQAGLSQNAVARMMGRLGRKSSTLISRLESGKNRCPTLGLIADFLKACGATFSDISDVLDQYTIGSPVAGKRKRKRKPKTREERIEQVKRYGASLRRKKRLEDRLFELLMDKELPEGTEVKKRIAEFGRNCFRARERTRRTAQEERGKLLARQGIGKSEADRIEQAMAELFQQMDESGELDRNSVVDAAGVVDGRVKLPNVKKAERRVNEQYLYKLGWRRMARYYLMLRIQNEMRDKVKEMGVEDVRPYLGLVPSIFSIAAETEPSADKRNKWVEEQIARARHKESVRQLIELVFERYEELKGTIPPRPEDWPGIASPPPKQWCFPSSNSRK